MLRNRTFVSALIAANLVASSVAANNRPGQGYERDFSSHQTGTQCEEYLTDHPDLEPILDPGEVRVIKRFRADGSYYASRFHNRNPMSTGNLYHECDATVVAYNPLPNGTILRITNPQTNVSVLAVVQDKGGPIVSHRPDLSRGLIEVLGNPEEATPTQPAEDIGLLKNVVYEVVIPIEN